jgi:dynein light chain 1
LKALQGLEDVSDTLEEIWVSYNSIDKLAGVEACTKLKVLYIANNLVKDWKEIDRLKSCVQLEELLLVGNPIVETSGDQFRIQIAGRLPWLKKLDGNPIDEEERELGRAAVPQ